jgi:hypothetical protein
MSSQTLTARVLGRGLLTWAVCLACAAPPQTAHDPVERHKQIAQQLLQKTYPPGDFEPLCVSRVLDGHVLTFRRTTATNEKAVEIVDYPALPIVVVNDSGTPREIARSPVNPARPGPIAAPPASFDSAHTVQLARRLASDGARLHCYVSLSGGAWVEFLGRGSQATTLSVAGEVIAVSKNGTAAHSFSF